MLRGTGTAVACAALAIGAAATGCRGEADSPYFGTTSRVGKDVHTLYVNNFGEPEYVDPGKSHDSTSSKLINHLFEGLATYDPDGRPAEGVAERYEETPDHRYFRFHLREDAKWNDGKPVTAADFEYAWKRVLDPKTVSQSSTNLYFVKNGELFNQGRLVSARGTVPVRDGSTDAAKQVSELSAGTPVVVLARSPVAISTSMPPFATIPTNIDGLTYDAANPKAKTPEKLLLLSGSEAKPVDPGGALAAGDYDIVKRLSPVVCNGEKDYFFEVAARDGSARGVLPGCMLGAASAQPTVLVGSWPAKPTFDPKARIDAPEEAVVLGFAPADDFESDASILGVRAVDDRTLEVEAEFPVPYILDLLCAATTYPVRKDVIEPFDKRGEPDLWTRPESIVTNGPYEIDSWRFRYEIRMRRNPHHRYFDKLQIHEIVWMAVESLVSTMNLYKTGELDYVGDNSTLPPPYIPFLKKKKDFRLANYVATYWYELNTQKPPFNDVRVRRALNLAIDKQELIDRITRGQQTPATHFTPDFAGGGYSDYVAGLREKGADPFQSPEVSYNPELARELLTQAGFNVVKDGDRWRADGMQPIELLYNTNEGHRAIAVAIQDMWKRNLGVSVSLRNEEWRVMLKNVRDRNFQVVRFGWTADYDHPQTWMDTFLSKSPNNRTGWSSARFDELIGKARTEPDQTESMRLYREAEQILVDEVPKIPLYFYTKTTLLKPWVKGFHFNRRNEQLVQWMWIDPNWESNPSNEPAISPPHFDAPGPY
ncbi:MAG: peptide ABC transporter substrate-binding protein [Polyangiaceae bacterium]